MDARRLFKAFIFFIGWILSPLTWWNDAFVNMPPEMHPKCQKTVIRNLESIKESEIIDILAAK